MSKELSIPPIASFCAKAMIRCFKKWKDSSCIISHLVKNIPTLSHYSWTKKARSLAVHKHNNKLPGEIKKFYWENIHYSSTPAIRSTKYKKFKFGFKKIYLTSIT